MTAATVTPKPEQNEQETAVVDVGVVSDDDNSCNKSMKEKMAKQMTMLPKGFEPANEDVILGRGRQARDHKGNKRLKDLIEFMIPEYQAAGNNKDEKSYIIKEIVTQIKKGSTGFVKFDKSKDRWFEVGEFLAREKISQTFRDAMGDSYSSSNPFKRKRRSLEKQSAMMNISKARRHSGASPTSVFLSRSSSGASSPSSTSPEPGPLVIHDIPLMATREVSPPMSPSVMSPGQIGFARQSMLRFGMTSMLPPPLPYPAAAAAAATPFGATPLRRPVPHLASPPPMSRRISMPGYPRPAYMMHHHAPAPRPTPLYAHTAAMMRRTSNV